MINKRMAYEELNLLPVWLHRKRQEKVKRTLFDIGSYFFKELNISIIFPQFDEPSKDEIELSKNLHTYMNSISENSKCIRNLKESELAATLKMNLSHHIFLIGDTKSMELNDLGINFKSSPSIEEMLGNTDKKKKLWHDIQSLLRDEMKGKF
jgi:hypothetical protein